ncbi:MAG: hypothetical protein GY878_08885 [Fuerstiella sp.]|nr:hypothetical protein [Fuerstiella sp.]
MQRRITGCDGHASWMGTNTVISRSSSTQAGNPKTNERQDSTRHPALMLPNPLKRSIAME